MMYIQVAGDTHSRAWIPQFMKNRGLLGRGRPRNWKQPMKSINQTLYTRTCAWWRHFIKIESVLHKRRKLFTCQISLFTCKISLFTRQISLFTCMISLFTCMISLFTCQTSLFTCQISLFTCQISLFMCKISLFSTKNMLYMGLGGVGSYTGALTVSPSAQETMTYLHGVLVSFLVGLSNTE